MEQTSPLTTAALNYFAEVKSLRS